MLFIFFFWSGIVLVLHFLVGSKVGNIMEATWNLSVKIQ